MAALATSAFADFEMRDAEDALWLLKKFGDSVDRRRTVRDLARMQYSSALAEPGQDVLLTEASHSGDPTHYPTGFVHWSGGDYVHDQGGGSGDEDEDGMSLLGNDRLHAYYSDGGDASHNLPIEPPSAINATASQPGRLDGPNPLVERAARSRPRPGL